jgi:hypothetical protein
MSADAAAADTVSGDAVSVVISMINCIKFDVILSGKVFSANIK